MEKNVNLVQLKLNKEIVETCVYKKEKHFVTNTSVILEKKIKLELEKFIFSFVDFCEIKSMDGIYFRIDAFLSEDMNSLNIIEINSHFVDGWGIALNLARASGNKVFLSKDTFPNKFSRFCKDTYLPEIRLFLKEAEISGSKIDYEIKLSNIEDKCYYYGKPKFSEYGKSAKKLYPAHPDLLDNKFNFARFSLAWNLVGKNIFIPKCFTIKDTSWENIPENVIFKPSIKDSEFTKKTGKSVLYRDEIFKQNLIKEFYNNGNLIAQEVIKAKKIDGKSSQIILLSAKGNLITGYLQLAEKNARIINDNSIHGPLIIK